MEQVPPTERANWCSDGWSDCNELDAIRGLSQCDGQMFAGYEAFESLYDERLVREIAGLADAVARACRAAGRKEAPSRSAPAPAPRTLIVFSGCGTSGRVAVLAARHFGPLFAERLGADAVDQCRVCGVVSGGDAAFVMSQELPEDDPVAGVRDLRRLGTDAADHVVLVGITCGLSAPYVMGQLDYAMDQQRLEMDHQSADGETAVRPKWTAALIGFNPARLARDRPVEGWGKTCRAVVNRLQAGQREAMAGGRPSALFLLNPVIGPEAVAGSSRMKGGTATFLLLAVVALLGLRALGQEAPPGPPVARARVICLLESFEALHRACYAALLRASTGGRLLGAGASCLRSNGRISYLGAGTLGLLGIVDASEMFDTYGLDYYQLRGFVSPDAAHEWSAGCDPACADRGADPLHRALFSVDAASFRRWVVRDGVGAGPGVHDLPVFSVRLTDQGRFLTADDAQVFAMARELLSATGQAGGSGTSALEFALVVLFPQHLLETVDVTDDAPRWFEGPAPVAERGFPVSWLLASPPPDGPLIFVPVPLPLSGGVPAEVAANFSCKLVYNALSTFSCAKKGVVCGNRMINLGVSNNKLFFRSQKLVQEFTGCSPLDAETALLRAIHDVDSVDSVLRNKPISHHIVVATPKPLVVPLAVVLAGRCDSTIESAKQALLDEPMVSKLIVK